MSLKSRLTKLERDIPGNDDPWADVMLVTALPVADAGGLPVGLHRRDRWSYTLVYAGDGPDRQAAGIPDDVKMIVLTQAELNRPIAPEALTGYLADIQTPPNDIERVVAAYRESGLAGLRRAARSRPAKPLWARAL